MKFYFKTWLFFFLLNILFPVSGQTLNLQSIPTDKFQLELSFQKSFFQSYNPTYLGLFPKRSDYSTLTGLYEINFNVPLGARINLIGDISFQSITYKVYNDIFNDSYSEGGSGNIFIGFQIKPDQLNSSNSYITTGIFLPTAGSPSDKIQLGLNDEKISISGLFTNYYDIPQFLPNSWGLYFNYAYHKKYDEGFGYVLEAGPNILRITSEGVFDETEIFLHYGISSGYQLYKLLLNIEFFGVAIVTSDFDNFGDRFVNQLSLGSQWIEDFITLKIFYRIYLREEFRNMIDGVLGIGVIVSF